MICSSVYLASELKYVSIGMVFFDMNEDLRIFLNWNGLFMVYFCQFSCMKLSLRLNVKIAEPNYSGSSFSQNMGSPPLKKEKSREKSATRTSLIGQNVKFVASY